MTRRVERKREWKQEQENEQKCEQEPQLEFHEQIDSDAQLLMKLLQSQWRKLRLSDATFVWNCWDGTGVVVAVLKRVAELNHEYQYPVHHPGPDDIHGQSESLLHCAGLLLVLATQMRRLSDSQYVSLWLVQ